MKISNWKLISAGFLLGGISVGGSVWWLNAHSLEHVEPQFGNCFLRKESCSRVLGKIDNEVISADSLPPDLQDKWLEAETERHMKLSKIIDEVSVRFAVAAEAGRNTALQQLPSLKELVGGQVTDDDVKKYFEQNKKSYSGKLDAQLQTFLRRSLEEQKMNVAMNRTLMALKEANRVQVSVPFPSGAEAAHALPSHALARGNGKEFELIYITDYHCGSCRYLRSPLERTLAKHGDKLRLVQIFSPAKSDTEAEYLAKGAYCASKLEDGKKFDAYNAHATDSPVFYDSQGKVRPAAEPRAATLASAQFAGLDSRTFETCVQSLEASRFIEENRMYAESLNIISPPAFFLNRLRVAIPPPLDAGETIDRILPPPRKAK
jgi:predicted DsbA family dithiol-disulfide isomerase